MSISAVEHGMDPSQDLLQRFTEERQKTLDLLHTLVTSDWSRMGIIYGQARSILDIGTWHGNHDVGHVAQVERLLRQWEYGTGADAGGTFDPIVGGA